MFHGLLISLLALYGFLFLPPGLGSHVLAGQNTGKTIPSGPQDCNKETWGTVQCLFEVTMTTSKSYLFGSHTPSPFSSLLALILASSTALVTPPTPFHWLPLVLLSLIKL